MPFGNSKTVQSYLFANINSSIYKIKLQNVDSGDSYLQLVLSDGPSGVFRPREGTFGADQRCSASLGVLQIPAREEIELSVRISDIGGKGDHKYFKQDFYGQFLINNYMLLLDLFFLI